MTLPVLPSLLAFDVRPTEAGSPPADVAAVFRQVLSTALQEASGSRLQASEAGMEGGDAVLQASGNPQQASGFIAKGSDPFDKKPSKGSDPFGQLPTHESLVTTHGEVAFVPAVPGAVIPAPPVAMSETSPPVISRPELHPEFRDRLERVIDRMESEFGYKVEVVETVRSQTRQDALYAQGREGPGPVVTWTRNSRHTDGLAADLLIDGSYVNPIGYERLAQVAREEGLRSLGPRDTGHVELPRAHAQAQIAGNDSVVTRAARPTEVPAWAVRGAPVAHLPKGERARQVLALNPNDNSPRPPAQEARPEAAAMAQPTQRPITVAEVASVAPVASVATVATVAVPGVFAAPQREERADKPAARRAAPSAPPISGNWGQTPLSRDRGLTPIPGIEPEADARDTAVMNDRPDTLHAMNLEKPASEAPVSTKPVSIDRSTTLFSADRIAEMLDLRDTAAERPLSSVLLRLDAPDGTEDRIRIGLRGTSLGADFDMADRHLADDLGRNLAELARSVERQGLEAEQLLVRSSWTRDSTTALSQAVAGERETLRSAAATSAGNGTASGRDGRAPRQDTPHDESPRQKPRRGQGDR